MKNVTMPVNIDPPQEDEQENFCTKEQLIQFLKYLKQEGNFEHYTLFRLLAFSGMRKSEALALTWNDINFTTKEIRINKTLSSGENNRLFVQTPKTKNSIHTMDKITLDILEEWNKLQKQDYLKLGINTLKPNQLVFSNEDNNYLQPAMTRKWMIRIQDKYSL